MCEKCPKCGHDSARRELTGPITRFYVCALIGCKCRNEWHEQKFFGEFSKPQVKQ